MIIKLNQTKRFNFINKNDISNELLTYIDGTKEPVTLINTRFGQKYVLATSHGDLILNSTSLKNLVNTFGEDTENWKRKEIKIVKENAIVKGSKTQILVVYPVIHNSNKPKSKSK